MISILDTHQHLVYPDHSPYSWTDGSPQLRNQSFRYEDYVQASQGTGISRTIFMETSPDQWREEVGWVYEIAQRKDSLLAGVIAGCRPEADGFEAYLESIHHPSLVGLRRTCHGDPDELSQQRRFVENVQRIGRAGLTFDLCFSARQLPLAADLAHQCPEVQFILDHCGAPDIAAGALDPWRTHIRQLSKLPNVACKISGVMAICKADDVTTEAVRPYVEHCLECFGWDRVVWGGDWPVCNLRTTLQQWVATSREIVQDAAPADQRKLFSENATRIYGLKETD